MADRFGWTLAEIDDTDMERMIEFVLYYLYWKGKHTPAGPGEKKQAKQEAYADEIDWSKL